MTRFLYDRLRTEVAALRRRVALLATVGGAHASSHANGGSDELDVTGLTGLLATPQTPATHATSHQNGGADEISVTGLSGLLADGQTPLTHASSHQNGGADEISVAGLSGQLSDAQPVGVRKNSAGSTFTRPRLNLIEGSNVTLTVSDDAGDGEVDVTVAAVGVGTWATVGAVFDGGGAAITTGEIVYVECPFAMTITAWRIVADQSGSIVVDVWKDTYANFPPTVADTIAASAKPTLSSAQKNQDTTLTGWTVSITAGDWIAFKVDSATTVERVTVQLTGTRT